MSNERFRDNVSITTLENGLRVVSEYVPSVQTVALGIYVRVGARFERADEAGLTHFVEHMLFKGTGRRSARDLVAAIESRGGSINAFTEKEYTCYYVRALAEDVPLATDILADMIRDPRLAEEDISLEKQVVLEEIRRSRDDPEDAVHELLDRTFWRGHPLSSPVLGTPRTIERLTREQIQRFLATRYEPTSIVLSAAGRVRHRELVRLARRYFGDMVPSARRERQRSPNYRHAVVKRHRSYEQVLFCIGMPAYAYHDVRKYPMTILDMVLGGTMSSRLFQEVREKRGLAYDIGTHVDGYRDGGLFSISGGTSPATFGAVVDLIHEEIRKVVVHGLTPDELEAAKRRLRGLIVFSLESMVQRMMGIGRSLLFLDRVIPLAEILQRVEAVTNDDIVAVASDLFQEDHEVIVALGPFGRNGGQA